MNVGQVDDGAGPQRLVAGVARLAADDRVLQVDEAEEQQVVAQERPGALVGGQAEEEAVGAPHVAAHRRDHVRVQLLLERALLRRSARCSWFHTTGP